jgi:phosphonopyruvate decarboxylase
MLSPAELTNKLSVFGYDFVTGVPCSLLGPLINQFTLEDNWRYFSAANEGLAVGLAAGAYIGGYRPVVFMQNSGLGNAFDGLTSLTAVQRIPLLLLISWRGEAGIGDEPQHDNMGRILPETLRLLGIAFDILATDGSNAEALLARADECYRNAESFAVVIREKTFAPQPQSRSRIRSNHRAHREHVTKGASSSPPSRISVIDAVQKCAPDTAGIVSSTGKMSRELLMINDSPRNLYVVGSMGLASTVGLGVSLATQHKVVVLDGDGAALMQMGAFAMIGSYAGGNLVHILLDNGVHESTGGQETVAKNVAFSQIAAHCGFPRVFETFDIPDFGAAFEEALAQNEGPVSIHAHVAPGSPPHLPRPSATPTENMLRFRAHLGIT